MHNVKLPSNRSFGTLFIVVFAMLAAWQAWHGAHSWMIFWFSSAVVTGVVTLIRPSWLAPLNRAWMALGNLLGRIVSPVVLGVMYVIIIVPVGAIMRMLGRDAMHRRYSDAPSYWQPRGDGRMIPERFKNQF